MFNFVLEKKNYTCLLLILVYFRAIPINTELKAFDNPVDVYILDPNRNIMRRWLSRQVCIY